MFEIDRPFYECFLGNCPQCNHRIDNVSGLDHVRRPEDLTKEDQGCIHCGDCGILLVWGNGQPLHLASAKERAEVRRQLGPEKFDKLEAIIEFAKQLAKQGAVN